MMDVTTINYDAATGITNHSNASTITPFMWADKGKVEKIFELVYLSLLALVGSVGNLIVIFSIILEKRIHAHGNIFIVNLAIADLLITGFVVPTVILNIVTGGNGLTETGCFVAGYTVTMTCTCSLCNLTLIAVNRFFAVVCQREYNDMFTRGKVYIMILGTWLWSNLLSFPTFLGWGKIAYDEKIELCSWDDDFSRSYTIFLTIFAVIIPLIVIFLCYGKLFCTVRTSGKWVRSITIRSGTGAEQNKRSIRKERNLLKTLAMTVAFFCICWLPYGLAIIIDAKSIAMIPKKIFGWLGLSNSAVNFVIYGVMNPVFRRGYKNLVVMLFLCKRKSKYKQNGIRRTSTHSDSFFRSARRKSNLSNLNFNNQRRGNVRTSSNDILKQENMNSEGSLLKNFTPLTCRKQTDWSDENARKSSMEASSQHRSSVFDCFDNHHGSEDFFKRDKKEIDNFLKEIENRTSCNSQKLHEINLSSSNQDLKSTLQRTRSDCRSKSKHFPVQRNRATSDITLLSSKRQMDVNAISIDHTKTYSKISTFINNNNEVKLTSQMSELQTNSENSRIPDSIKDQEKKQTLSTLHDDLHRTVKTVMSMVIQDNENCEKQIEVSKL